MICFVAVWCASVLVMSRFDVDLLCLCSVVLFCFVLYCIGVYCCVVFAFVCCFAC